MDSSSPTKTIGKKRQREDEANEAKKRTRPLLPPLDSAIGSAIGSSVSTTPSTVTNSALPISLAVSAVSVAAAPLPAASLPAATATATAVVPSHAATSTAVHTVPPPPPQTTTLLNSRVILPTTTTVAAAAAAAAASEQETQPQLEGTKEYIRIIPEKEEEEDSATLKISSTTPLIQTTRTRRTDPSTIMAILLKVLLGLFLFGGNIFCTYSFLTFTVHPTETAILGSYTRHKDHEHVLPPFHLLSSSSSSSSTSTTRSNTHNNGTTTTTTTTTTTGMNDLSNAHDYMTEMTLRKYLTHENGIHVGLAPAFFGYNVYFGVLTSLLENLNHNVNDADTFYNDTSTTVRVRVVETPKMKIKSVAGASAGAMAAVMLSMGLNPRDSADFASTMTLSKFWDPPGIGGFLKGDLFQSIMVERLDGMRLEEGEIPVAVTTFDVKSLQGKILTRGCMGKAARSSACFPLLFQPVQWKEEDENETFILIDGGVMDPHGVLGLSKLLPEETNKRIVNIVAGGFPQSKPLGPSEMPQGMHVGEVLSLSIQNMPKCAPWAMENCPRAATAAMEAITAVLDTPMYQGKEAGHYVLSVDATMFAPP